ncbi:hypothetical protein CMI42_01465 [Candidatus Pacearchaeota archaeon]|nr:hypothetical protein [Candidatus Pacearchaeota archaeon]|tara:strand:- start:1106 stop:1348 length:243 start_codon:yes stop_codon:yes gene_type:complete
MKPLKKKKQTSIHYLFLVGIVITSLGLLLVVIHYYESSWVNMIPSASAPIIASFTLILMGLLLIISWIKHVINGRIKFPF